VEVAVEMIDSGTAGLPLPLFIAWKQAVRIGLTVAGLVVVSLGGG
jgi:hypothetical protein